MHQLLGNLSPLAPESYDDIAGQLAGRELPRYVALFVVTSQAVAIHTGDKIDTVIGQEVAPLAKHLNACTNGHRGRHAIVIDRDEQKAWCVGFTTAARLVIDATAKSHCQAAE